MRVRGVVVLIATLALTACGGGGTSVQKALRSPTTARGSSVSTAPTVPATTTTTLGYTVYKAALASTSVGKVDVYDDPTQAGPSRTLANPDPFYGTSRVFLVTEDRGDWLHVLLPVRPNGSTGWIRSSDMIMQTTTYHIVVELGAHQLTLFDKNDVVLQAPVGVGKSATPSTTGLFFTAERVNVQPDQQSAYGPYAFGLSAYSEVLYDFGGGDGQMGIHGTGDPSSVGKDVSNGCIRLTNDNITKLADTLPDAGVPVEIRA
jgi:lipoprotein-anchoring transpeptidase ErfK/SrfK